MASQSLTAVASVVSVMKEKTVIALKINTRGCERVFYPMIVIVICCLSVACLAVAAGTPGWVKVNALQDIDGELEDRGSVTFGLFRESHSVSISAPVRLTGSNDIRDRFTAGGYENISSIPLSRIYTAFAFDLTAIMLCVVTIAVTLLNSYQTVTTWWKGPAMMYMLALFTSLIGFTAVGIFSDFFIWQLIGTSALVRSLGNYEHLLNPPNPYSTTQSLGYSFWLLFVGATIPLFSTLLSWRLAVLVHPRRPQDNTTLSASPSGFQMGDIPSLAGLGGSKQSGSVVNYERGGPLLY